MNIFKNIFLKKDTPKYKYTHIIIIKSPDGKVIFSGVFESNLDKYQFAFNNIIDKWVNENIRNGNIPYNESEISVIIAGEEDEKLREYLNAKVEKHLENG